MDDTGRHHGRTSADESAATARSDLFTAASSASSASAASAASAAFSHRRSECRRWSGRLLKHAWAFVRSSVALLSAILAWLGVWELMDLHAWPRSVPRDLAYVLVSAAVMVATGTLLPNCGIYEDHSGQDAATRTALENAEDIDAVMGLEDSPSPQPASSSVNSSSSGMATVAAASADDDRATLIELTPPCRDSPMGDSADDDVSPDPPLASDPHSSGRSYRNACLFMLTRLCTCEMLVHVYLRSLVSLFASIVFWAGSYNLLLELFLLISGQREPVAYTLNLVFGWLLMWSTGTLFDQAGLTEEEEQEQHGSLPLGAHAVAEPSHSCFHLPPRVRVYLRAFFAITGCMMFWLGASMLLELLGQALEPAADDSKPAPNRPAPLHCQECEDSTPARNAVWVTLGIVFFLITNTYAVHAGVEESNQSAQHSAPTVSDDSASAATSSHRTLLSSHPLFRHAHALVSLTGVMLVWEGIWDSAFTATTESAAERMVVYTAAGLVGLMLTDSLFTNSGVVPPFAMAQRATHVQQQLGFHLQEKQFRRAARGGFPHDPVLQSIVAVHHAEAEAEAEAEQHRATLRARQVNEDRETFALASPTAAYHTLQPAASSPPTNPSPSLEPFHSLHE